MFLCSLKGIDFFDVFQYHVLKNIKRNVKKKRQKTSKKTSKKLHCIELIFLSVFNSLSKLEYVAITDAPFSLTPPDGASNGLS